MITTSKESVVALTITVLFALATGIAIYLYSVNNRNAGELEAEKVKSEKMLSEKLALAKEIEKLKKEIIAHKGRNNELDKSLNELQQQLDKKQRSMNNGSMVSYQKEIAELKAMRDQLRSELNEVNKQLAALNSENSNLRNALSLMEESNEHLANKNYMLTQMMADKYGIEARRKSEKLTVKAKKVKEIVMGFDVPAQMTDNLKFTITSPDGKKVTSSETKTISYVVDADFQFSDATVVATTGSLFTAPMGNAKRVALTYKPESKLKSGVYQVDIYSENNYLGSSQLKLQ